MDVVHDVVSGSVARANDENGDIKYSYYKRDQKDNTDQRSFSHKENNKIFQAIIFIDLVIVTLIVKIKMTRNTVITKVIKRKVPIRKKMWRRR